MSAIATSSAILIGVVQRQHRHRRAEADPLPRRRQRHQRVGEYGELPVEVNLAEPDRIKAERVGRALFTRGYQLYCHILRMRAPTSE
jgi:hypothetical protein